MISKQDNEWAGKYVLMRKLLIEKYSQVLIGAHSLSTLPVTCPAKLWQLRIHCRRNEFSAVQLKLWTIIHYWSREEWNSKKLISKDNKNISSHCANIRSNRRMWVNFNWRNQFDTRVLTCQSWHRRMPEFQSVASIMHVCTTSTVSANYLLDYFKFLINDYAIRRCPITVFICRTITAWCRIWYSQGSIVAFDHDDKKRWSNEGEELNPPISQPQLTEIVYNTDKEFFASHPLHDPIRRIGSESYSAIDLGFNNFSEN